MDKPVFVLQPSTATYKQEKDQYARQWSYLATHRPPDPYADQGAPELTGWGIPPYLHAPKSAVRFVDKLFREEIARTQNVLRPKIEFWIMASVTAHFMWFLTPEGAEWVLSVFGIEELEPFSQAYTYAYRDPSSGVTTAIDGQETSLRIFENRKPRYNPPISSEDKALADGGATHKAHRRIMAKCFYPYAQEAMDFPTPAYSHYISSFITDWFTQSPTTPSRANHWKHVKHTKQAYQPKKGSRGPEATNGYDWATRLLRAPNVPFFPALHYLHKYQPKRKRVFRLQRNGGPPLWCNEPDIRDVSSMTPQEIAAARRTPTILWTPRREYNKQFRGMTHEQDVKLYTCVTCGTKRTCVPISDNRHMCCHCYGTVVEADLRPTLDYCAMRECQRCPDHISSEDELVKIKNQLNRGPEYPIYRQTV